MFKVIRVSTITAILLLATFSMAAAGKGDTPPDFPFPNNSLSGKFPGPAVIPVNISNVSALESTVYYGPGADSVGCEAEELSIRANIRHFSGIVDAYVRYRYMGYDGSVGSWHTSPVHDYAMGGLHGFIIDVAAEAGGELGTVDGTLEYQLHAESGSGVQGYYPDGYVLGVSVEYCP